LFAIPHILEITKKATTINSTKSKIVGSISDQNLSEVKSLISTFVLTNPVPDFSNNHKSFKESFSGRITISLAIF
jgi:hypothetical protein